MRNGTLIATSGLLLSTLLLGGCNNDVDNGFVSSLQLRDKFNQVEDSFIQGDNITISLSIKNDSTARQTLNFATSQQYDLVLKDAQQNEVWRWSANKAFLQAATSFELGPTDMRTLTESWDQAVITSQNEAGDTIKTLVEPGSYTLEAYFIGYGNVAQSALHIQ